MYSMKYIFGQTVKYNGKKHKIKDIRFSPNGVLYKLSFISYWVKEEDIYELD